MAKKCCGKWKKKNKFCSSCPVPKDMRAQLTGKDVKIKKGKKIKKAESGKKKDKKKKK
jgi:hypothetical protein